MARRLPQSKDFVHQVNRHMASCRFQLHLLQSSGQQLNPLQESACVEAALFHLHLALQLYLDELLSYYQKPAFLQKAEQEKELSLLLHQGHECFAGLNEFSELQQTVNNSSLPWEQLAELKDVLTDTETLINLESSAPEKKPVAEAVIPVLEIKHQEEQKNIFEASTVLAMLDELQTLIEKQREYQTES